MPRFQIALNRGIPVKNIPIALLLGVCLTLLTREIIAQRPEPPVGNGITLLLDGAGGMPVGGPAVGGG